MSKYQIRQTLHRAPLAAAVGSVLAAGQAHAGDLPDPTIVVTSNADAPLGTVTGACTLRDAVEAAQTASPVGGCGAGTNSVDIIGFDQSLAESTISLSQGQIEVSHGGVLYVRGPVEESVEGITIDAGGDSRIFRAQDSGVFGLKYLTLANGEATTHSFNGGAVAAYGTDLVLDHARVMDSTTTEVFAYGGGVFVDGGDLTLDNSFVLGSSTTGYLSFGGGVAVVNGDLTMTGSRVKYNSTGGNYAGGGGVLVAGGGAAVVGSYIVGNATDGYAANGGGLSIRNGELALTDSQVLGNSTEQGYSYGGGLFIHSTDAHLENTTIAGNSTAGHDAGGGGIALFNGDLSLESVTISENSTEGDQAHGGGLFASAGPSRSVAVVGSTVSGNLALGNSNRGGGVYIRNSNNASVSMSRAGSPMRISDNRTGSFGGGGGVYIYNAGSPAEITLSSLVLLDNQASSGGGLLVNGSNAALINPIVLNGCILSGNSAQYGGGGINAASGGVTMNHCRVTANSALNGSGGGLSAGAGPVIIQNSTFSGNSAQELYDNRAAAAVYRSGTDDVTLTHVTIADNTGHSAIRMLRGNSLLRLNNSLIVHGSAVGQACNAASINHVNSLASDESCTGQATDPLALNLGPLRPNPWFTPTYDIHTHALGAGSVAINAAGDCAAEFDIGTDQRGYPRPASGSPACDIGAFESQGDGDGSGDVIFLDRFEE